MKRIATALSLLLATLLVPVAAGATSRPTSLVNNRISLSECIERDKKLDVLFIVDQSISLLRNKEAGKTLPGNDPDNERVTGLKAVLRILKTKADQEDSALNVTVAHAGFGNGFTLHQNWTELDDRGFDQLLLKIEAQKDLNTERYTQYHEALKGAVRVFGQRSDEKSCRMAIWFSDGKHDNDDAGKGDFTSQEIKQVRDDICGPKGLADQLRSNGIFLVAAGLNPNVKDLELMRLISENSGSLKNPALSDCGSLPAYGKFEVTKNADQLVESLFNLVNITPGATPAAKTESKRCRDGTPNCSEISFAVTDLVSEFTMVVDRGRPSVSVQLTTGPGQKHDLFREEKIRDANASVYNLSAKKLYLNVQRKKNGTINGEWNIRFIGDGNDLAEAIVKFVGNAEVKAFAKNEVGERINLVSIDRYDTTGITIEAKIRDSGISVTGLSSLLRIDSSDGGFVDIDLATQQNSDGSYVVSADQLKKVLFSDVAKGASRSKLIVKMSGSIPGLIDVETNDDVLVEFADTTFAVVLTNGKTWPAFIKQISTPLIVGTDKQEIRFQFRGADGRSAKLVFKDSIDKATGLVFVSGQTCEIASSELADCILELKPSEQSYGVKSFVASGSFQAAGDNPGTQAIDIPFEIRMEKSVDVRRGVVGAVVLFLAFLIILAIQRYFFAFLMSRFAKLNPTDRRARIDIEISESGHISGPNGSLLAIKNGDESFVFENAKPEAVFYLFGYQFETSTMRTFMKSTSAPQGFVKQDGKFVFGSAGLVTKKKSIEPSAGVVSLSLRKQWVIGVDSTDISRLAEGANQVSAELVVYLDAPERTPFDEQLSNVNFEIAGGRFPDDLANLLAKVREQSFAVDVDADDPFGRASTADLDDPFATSATTSSFDADTEAGDSAKSSKRFSGRKRKSKTSDSDENVGNQFGGSANGDFDDPFA